MQEDPTRTEFGVARTVCSCGDCLLNCFFMPGALIPSDLERMIPAYIDPLTWAERNLLASPGAIVSKGGEVFRIPTLVPARGATGACIHLTTDGRCSIHPVAPFSCAFFDCGPDRREEVGRQGLITIARAQHDRSSLYATVWEYLSKLNLVAEPCEVLIARKHKFKEKVLREATMATIRVICMYCQRHYKDKPGGGVAGISHGICPECEAAPRHEPCGFPKWYCEKTGACRKEGNP